MVKKRKKASSIQKLRALEKTQHINDMLERSTIESEALQNAGYDRPVDESHILDLLNVEEASPKRAKRSKAQKRTRLNKPKKTPKGAKKKSR